MREIRDVFAKAFAAQTDPSVISGLLYVALAAGAKDEALAAAKRVLGTAKDPALLDTLAECYHVHGDRADALRVEDQTIAAATREMASALAAHRARFAKGTGDAHEITEAHDAAARRWQRLSRIAAVG